MVIPFDGKGIDDGKCVSVVSGAVCLFHVPEPHHQHYHQLSLILHVLVDRGEFVGIMVDGGDGGVEGSIVVVDGVFVDWILVQHFLCNFHVSQRL